MKQRVCHMKVEFPVKLFFSNVNHPASLKWHSWKSFALPLCFAQSRNPLCVLRVSHLPSKWCALCTLCAVCECVCFKESLQRWQDSWTNEERDKHLDRAHQVDSELYPSGTMKSQTVRYWYSLMHHSQDYLVWTGLNAIKDFMGNSNLRIWQSASNQPLAVSLRPFFGVLYMQAMVLFLWLCNYLI